ncbi:DUF4424 domain-containing protein [Aquibium carbonis]|uniref:DUF4424 domain-containing protein n=1 Tax=Aquibium carbonis TaxID=2495581 RepID=A0A3S0AT33_9HYPH|nr:DUF4424 domain-containing protein [Aquibium carbonis]RST86463.1 DUF4424 domain-containing protein [Aquibium carbonis]
MKRFLATLLLGATATAANANDSTAQLGAGGLVLSRSDVIEMAREELYLSKDAVRVDYVFRNRSDEDVAAIVAFPMPDIEASPYHNVSIPFDARDDFLGFEVVVNGEAVVPQLEQRAFAVGIDVTADLAGQRVPLFPYGGPAEKALAALPADILEDWLARGIVIIEEFDFGKGMQRVVTPFWRLTSTYWWRMTFPAGADVEVAHRYTPSVGSTVGVTFFSQNRLGGDALDEYRRRYCMDTGFENAVLKAAKASPDGYPRLYETRLSYVLTTGGNWASGTIGDFRLTIDKGDPKNIVSFCGTGVRKTGPTTFEMRATDFHPERDIEVLILEPYQVDPGSGG